MKKILTIVTFLCLHGFVTQAFHSTEFTYNYLHNKPGNGGKKMEITVGSSRTSGDMHIRFRAKKAGNASIAILDESGKVVLQQSSQVADSVNTIPLKDATALGEGAYTVRLIFNNETYTTRFLIWK